MSFTTVFNIASFNLRSRVKKVRAIFTNVYMKDCNSDPPLKWREGDRSRIKRHILGELLITAHRTRFESDSKQITLHCMLKYDLQISCNKMQANS